MKRLLIIDNEPDVLEMMKEVFVYDGFDVHAAPHAGNLAEVVANIKPNLLLIDFSLDGQNGGEVCAQLKHEGRHAQLPVIIISAYANKGLTAGSYGCDDFIIKPFDLYDLLSRIKNALARSIVDNSQF